MEMKGEAASIGRIAEQGPAGRFGDLAFLLLLQAAVCAVVFREFLDGSRYFAYLDIAADTYEQYTAHAMHHARLFAREGWSGWSFQIGLGAPLTFSYNDPFRFLAELAGPDRVLQ